MNGKLLILTGKLIYKTKNTFLVLLAEMVLTTFIFMSIAGKVQMLYESRDLSETFQGTNGYYFAPYEYYEENENFDIQHILNEQLKGSAKIGTIALMELTTADGDVIDGYGYNDTIISYANINIKEGQWFCDVADTKEYIPIISIGDAFRLGENIKLDSGKQLKVIGVIDPKEYILLFNVTTSKDYGSLSNFVHLPELDYIIPYDCGESRNSIQESDTIMCDEQMGKMLVAEDDIDKEKMYDIAGQYGSVSNILGMQEKYNMENQDYLIENGISLCVFTLLSLIGIAGINGVQSILNEKMFVIYYMLGLTGKQCTMIEIFRSASLMLATFAIVLFGYCFTPIKSWYSGEEMVVNGYTFLCIAIYLACIYIGTSAAFIKKLNSRNLIQLYKKNA